MRIFSCLIIALSLILCSCNNNEPVTTIGLPISETYIPATIEINVKTIDDDLKHNLLQLVNRNAHIVNSRDELPADPIGVSEAFNRINFNEYTLLILYLLHDYTLDTYRNTFYLQTQENLYNWSVNIGTSSDLDNNDTDELFFTRFAIVVKKLPADAQVRGWYGLTNLGWYPATSE